jgi:hypothetical protein
VEIGRVYINEKLGVAAKRLQRQIKGNDAFKEAQKGNESY